MKSLLKYVLQKILGYERYLYLFSKFKIKNLHKDRKEKDFFCFMNQIEKEGLILDVGANIGIMTYHLSKKFENRTIYAIEPIPSNFVVLKKIVSKYNLTNVDLLPFAVGDKTENLEMVLPVERKVKMQGLAHVVHDSIDEWNEGEIVNVPCKTLDEIVEKDKVAGIKMDIENFEFFALKGAVTLLKRHKPVVYLELWENDNRQKCFELLQGVGYEVFVNIDGQLTSYQPEIHTKQNFIFK